MLIQEIKCGIRGLLLEHSEITLGKRWYLQLFLIPSQVYPKSLT